MKSKLGFLICQNFYEEIHDILSTFNNEQIILKSYPSECIVKQRLNSTSFEKQIEMLLKECSRIEIFCSNGCVDADSLKETFSNVNVHQFDTCFEYLLDKSTVEYYIEQGFYLITRGWLKNWRTYIEDVWKFNEDVVKEFFAQSAKKLLYLDSTPSTKSHKLLSEMSEFVGLEYEIVPVSTRYLKTLIGGIVKEFEKDALLEGTQKRLVSKNKMIAEYAMITDLFNRLSKLTSEEEAIKEIFELLSHLFGPKIMAFISIVNNEAVSCKSIPEEFDIEPYMIKLENSGNNYYDVTDSGEGFCVKIEFNGETIGVIVIDYILFSEYRDESLNQFLNFRHIIGLTISNARNYAKILKEQDNLKDLAFYDNLTGLHNRHAFLSLVDKKILNSRQNERFAVIYIDVDDFKPINDTYGHKYGDEALIVVAKSIQASLRDSDECARIGGDEFAVLIDSINESSDLHELYNRIQKNLNRDMMIIDVMISMRASIGIAIYPENGKDIESLFAYSDKQMYLKKKEKKELPLQS